MNSKVKQLILEQKLYQHLSFLWIRNLHIKRIIWIRDLLEVELPCARELTERGGGACLARSIAGENWHNPIEPRSFLPAESLAPDQRRGNGQARKLQDCMEAWDSILRGSGHLQLLLKTNSATLERADFYSSTSELFMARPTWDRQREHPHPQFVGLWPEDWGCSCTVLCAHNRAVEGYFAQCSHACIPSPPI